VLHQNSPAGVDVYWAYSANLSYEPNAWRVPHFRQNPLAFDDPGAVGREGCPVVLVGLPDHSLVVGPEEMDRQPEVVGCEVREAVGRHLVGDVEDLFQVLRRDVALAPGGREELDRGPLRGQHRPREVVGLHPLTEELAEVLGVAVAQGEMPEGLQDHRPGGPRRHGVALVDVDATVLEVRDRIDRYRQILHTVQREAVVGDERRQRALRHRTALVAR